MHTINDGETHSRHVRNVGCPTQSFPDTAFGGFHDRRDTNEWKLYASDDKNFLAALNQRNSAWYPQRNKPIVEIGNNKRKFPQSSSQSDLHATKRFSSETNDDAQQEISVREKAISEGKSDIKLKFDSKDNVTKFPPIIKEKQEFVGIKIRKDHLRKSKTNLSNITTNRFRTFQKSHQNVRKDHTSYYVNRIPIRLHARTAVYNVATITRSTKINQKRPSQIYATSQTDKHLVNRTTTAAAAANTRCAMVSTEPKKKQHVEPAFRLPRIKVLPPIDSVSIPIRGGNSLSQMFQDGVNGSAVTVTKCGKRSS